MTLLENMLIAIESKQSLSLFPWGTKNKVNRDVALEYLQTVKLEEKAQQKASSLSGGQMRLLEITRSPRPIL